MKLRCFVYLETRYQPLDGWTVHATHVVGVKPVPYFYFPPELDQFITNSRLQVHKATKMNAATAESCIRTRSSVKTLRR